MKNYNVDTLIKYKELISNESYLFIIEEMLVDLKSILLENSSHESIHFILEEFNNIDINNPNIMLDNLINHFVVQEGVVADISKAISNMKAGFGDKHEKIVARDKKWLAKNKKTLLSLNFEEIELEVLSDYKVSFEQLVRRHDIFDKTFTSVGDNGDLSGKLRRFGDKHDNLKNGLDNYYRTGTSRREIGLRKLAGEEARVAVENMIAYCESFINGKNFLEEKMNNILVAVNDSKIEESSVLNILKEAENIDSAIKGEGSEVEFIDNKNKKSDNNENSVESEPKEKTNKNEEPIETDEEEEPPMDEEIPEEDAEQPEENTSPERSIRDRQTGIAVLLTVAEARYFDYINVLKGLLEE